MFSNKLTHVKNHAKCLYNKNLIKCNNNNPSRTWSIVKEIIDYKNSAKKTVLSCVITIKDESVRTDALKFVKSLCEYFANIGTKMSQKLACSNAFSFKIHSRSCMHPFMLHIFMIMYASFYDIGNAVLINYRTPAVNYCISNIKPYSPPGMDGIPSKFAKFAWCILTSYLAKLFNKCIEQEIFPRDFKVAYVIPNPKTSSPKSHNEFRPVSLLSVFSKLCEQILKNKMRKFIN